MKNKTSVVIPAPEKTGIKVLAFDQGGIYIGVNYDATIQAFERLEAVNAASLYTQADQSRMVDDFECGKVSASVFYGYLRRNLAGIRTDVKDVDLFQAWNAMLTGVIPGILEFIQMLRSAGYITVVVSNADEIHQAGVVEQLEEAGVMHLFAKDSFDERYISHIFGYNKPYREMFERVTTDLQKKFPTQKIERNQILFIDDSEKHLVGRNEREGAQRVGWDTLYVASNLPVHEFQEKMLAKLASLAKTFRPKWN